MPTKPTKPTTTAITTAQRMRHSLSLPEKLLWRYLRASPQGIKVRRQHPLGDYILDFYIAPLRLAI